MASFEVIRQKLEVFIKKYYTNELIRGVLLFLAIGLLYFLITLLVEYYLWLNSAGRKMLFWTFIVVEISLFIRLIIFPISKLFKFRKGINYDEASRIIGQHFSEVNDKLLNLIQLNRNAEKSDLLMASIQQKSEDLQPIPFANAIRFQENLKYLKYVAIPIFIFLAYTLLGDSSIFSGSYGRVVNYDVAYEPPAPFSFVIVNNDLHAIENTSFTLKVKTEGKTVPENVSITYNNQQYYLQKSGLGEFEYTFEQPVEPIHFRLHSNKVKSGEYELKVIPTPALSDFEMELVFPTYTGIPTETVRSTGNATIPEGTKVHWKLAAKNTEQIHLKTNDTLFSFQKQKNAFALEQNIFNNLDYTISTSNQFLNEYENLSYTLQVIKDQFPEMEIESKRDSTDFERILFLGRVSDDYGLTKLQIVYYPEGQENKAIIKPISVQKSTFDEFVYEFPGDLDLEEGISYEYYFEVFDNDRIHNYKSTKSGLYSFGKLTKNEIESEQLEKQAETIQNMDRSLKEIQENKDLLEELSRTQKEKTELNYNDRKRLEDFLKRQQKQEELMKNFSKKLEEDLDNFQKEKEDDAFKEELKERLRENEKRSEENERLLKELEELQDKIKQEDLINKLDQMSNERKKQERNLEQLVELTKRYYVEKKAERIAEELQKLGERQEQLSEKNDTENTVDAQNEMNENFDRLMEELEQLREENDTLKSPMDFLNDDNFEEDIKEDQQNATDKLEDGKPADAKSDQKDAGQKMKQKGMEMMSEMQSGQMEMLEEDIAMIRRILSNLIRFSFEQEDVMLDFRQIEFGSPVFGRKLRIQNELRQNFQHIDDSIFALSVRHPQIGDKINASLTDIEFNLETSLENFADNKMRQGSGNQQYVMKGANDLAVLLDELMNNLSMQMSMAASGTRGKPEPGGPGGGFQLPDIIQKQQSLIDQMGEGMEDGAQEGDGEGMEGEGEGENGEGIQNENGEGGEGGSEGNNGQGGKEGEGNMDREGMSGEIFEIYKQQQKLRQELEDMLRREGIQGDANRLLRDMERVEQRLLENGFNQATRRQMEILKYELLKMEEASYKQGEEERREATANLKEYKNTRSMDTEDIKRYFNTTEILNRESLPLRNDYQNRVRDYFKNRHD